MARITVLYDNHANEELRAGWGFSALVEAEATRVLFDTGADLLVFEHNARALGVDLKTLDAVVVSHDHCDHVGGLPRLLRKGLPVYLPATRSARFPRASGRDKLLTRRVRRPLRIAPGVHSTGTCGRAIREQAVLVDGSNGPALLTGCAHPGIAVLVQRATRIASRPPRLLVGGLHLYRSDEARVRAVADELIALGVERIAPCHCTGDKALPTLRAAFGDGFVDVRAGTRIDV